ncbi:MAG: glucose 1-dehydrogenase [Gammaproteobacteria bacterium]|nr:glucose 1-dehydrogenase [Gammaproteobacteria bacterium]
MDFTDRIALVTGGGNGIGKTTALAFAERGASVMVVDLDEAAAQSTAHAITQAGGTASHTAANVTQAADVQAYVKATLDRFGRIDCFFNNAGIAGDVAPIAEYDEEVFDRVIAVNVKGVFLGMRHVLPVMLARKRGTVVNTASVAGLVGSPGMPAYVASKHAVIGLTKVAAGEVSGEGIRVNAVCPGPIDTRMVHDIAAQVSPDDPGAVRRNYEASIPLGRYGTPQEVANVVLFLACDLSANVTGAQYVVDGGRTASPKGVTAKPT